MKKTIHICNHCGKEINPMNDYTDMEIDDFNFIKEVDLCKKCHDELCNLVRNFINEV